MNLADAFQIVSEHTLACCPTSADLGVAYEALSVLAEAAHLTTETARAAACAKAIRAAESQQMLFRAFIAGKDGQ